MLIEFSLTCIFHHVWEKIFQFMVFTFLENALSLCVFTHDLVLHSKLQAEFFKTCFPQEKRGGGNYDLLYQNSVRKHKDDLEHYLFTFCMIYNFYRCDGYTVL